MLSEMVSRLIKSPGAVALPALVASLFFGGCQQARNVSNVEKESANLVVLSAPANGTVRRVMVGENLPVAQNAAILEIAAESETTTSPTLDPNAQLREQARGAQAETKRLEERVERAAVEAQRVESLVAAGAAPQPQLDAARAEYQRAQEDLQRAQSGAKSSSLAIGAVQRSESITSQSNPATSSTIVTMRATSAGTVRVINARVGQRVSKGQPLATLSIGG